MWSPYAGYEPAVTLLAYFVIGNHTVVWRILPIHPLELGLLETVIPIHFESAAVVLETAIPIHPLDWELPDWGPEAAAGVLETVIPLHPLETD